MGKKGSEWVGVNEAANLVAKSLSTIRRLIPEMEKSGYVRRETGKVLIDRGHLVERFGVTEGESEQAERGDFAGIIEMLERQIVAKDRQIENLQRDGESKSRQMEEAQLQAAQLAESLKQFAALNAALQSKILGISSKSAEPLPGVKSGVFSSPIYFILVAVFASLVAGLLVYIFLQWVGNG